MSDLTFDEKVQLSKAKALANYGHTGKDLIKLVVIIVVEFAVILSLGGAC